MYGRDRLAVELGVCESEGAVLVATMDVGERNVRGRGGREEESCCKMLDWNCRRYRAASEFPSSRISGPFRPFPSSDCSEKLEESLWKLGVRGERRGTISGTGESSSVKKVDGNGVGGGDSRVLLLSLRRQLEIDSRQQKPILEKRGDVYLSEQ